MSNRGSGHEELIREHRTFEKNIDVYLGKGRNSQPARACPSARDPAVGRSLQMT
jgi:hypothetical protein